MTVFAEYIWLDGYKPTQQLRSKTKVLDADRVKNVKDLPEWALDRKSTRLNSSHIQKSRMPSSA